MHQYRKIDIKNKKQNQQGITSFIESDYGQFLKNKKHRVALAE